MKKMNLVEAILTIPFILKLKDNEIVTAIQYEDSSGFKFNYQINHGSWKFIDLTNTDKVRVKNEIINIEIEEVEVHEEPKFFNLFSNLFKPRG